MTQSRAPDEVSRGVAQHPQPDAEAVPMREIGGEILTTARRGPHATERGHDAGIAVHEADIAQVVRHQSTREQVTGLKFRRRLVVHACLARLEVDWPDRTMSCDRIRVN